MPTIPGEFIDERILICGRRKGGGGAVALDGRWIQRDRRVPGAPARLANCECRRNPNLASTCRPMLQEENQLPHPD